MSWISNELKANITPTRKASIPEGCDRVIAAVRFYTALSFERNLEVRPKCTIICMSARNRLHSLLG